MRFGLIPKASAVPVMATVVESMKPGGVRSSRYQIAGLERARVRESWSVDCHGNLRCQM